jgi:hypothetical protein
MSWKLVRGIEIPTEKEDNTVWAIERYYYIIMSKDGKSWIPTKKNRNSTSVNLTDKEPPRLFSSRGDALRAIKWWKQGVYYSVSTGGGYNEHLKVRKIKEREEIGLIIVEVILSIIPF